MCGWVCALIACGLGGSAPDEPATPDAPPTPADAGAGAPGGEAVEHVFVHASLLRLRPEPSSSTRSYRALAINTRLRVGARKDAWIEVTTPDGRQGWVHGDFVGSERLTSQHVQDQISAAETEAERLSWWQRAAALQPSEPVVLRGLINAYRAAGRDEDAASVQALLDAQAAGFEGWFPEQVDEVRAITSALPTVSDDGALLQLWSRAVAVTEAMSEPLNARFEAEPMFSLSEQQRAWIEEEVPWARLGIYAEGTYASLELERKTWAGAAARTGGDRDDRFLALVALGYDNASAQGWPLWLERNWDYGGCSRLGWGVPIHQQILEQAQALAGVKEVAPTVARIRDRVMADLLKPKEDEFPYCDGTDKQTPTAALVSAVEQILADVELSTAERAALAARVEARFGRE